jgi:putative PEP-CTERM system histidine kinase
VLRDETLWIIAPLIHIDRIEGIAILSRPSIDRALDWEDFDLLRIAGRQAASHIAEAHGSEALAESARFEEFHRRFAFIMHDVKNLASQMALLARNAERHGDKPEFREDMIETLRVSADRLSQLMQRLSQQDRVRVDQLMAVDIAIIVRRVATAARRQHGVTILGAQQAYARANAETVEQLLTHLLQNAIDASPEDAPITLRMDQDGSQMRLSVEDQGQGMSPLFIRNELFRPFSSTKEGGFGIGAYQARQLAEAMGGQLHVSSIEGRGTSFTLVLPQATPDNFEPNRSEAA